MAKSVKSKRKRKFRAIKREKIAKREMVKMKKMLGMNDDGTVDTEMKDLYSVTDSAKLKKKTIGKNRKTDDNNMDTVASSPVDKMEVDSKIDKDTMKNEHGNYPTWMSRRKVQKIKDKKRKRTKYAW
ncbi:protein LLP homolog [Glandiceps talaboti]